MATGDPWVFQKQREAQPVISMTAPPENNIVLYSGSTEMLRIAEDGFYVRGVKVTQDDKESEEVYNCFKEWLNWSTLNRN
jgi:hypothetical protein